MVVTKTSDAEFSAGVGLTHCSRLFTPFGLQNHVQMVQVLLPRHFKSAILGIVFKHQVFPHGFTIF